MSGRLDRADGPSGRQPVVGARSAALGPAGGVGRTHVAALGRRSGAVLEALADAFAAPAAPLPAPVATAMRRDAGRWLGATPVGQRLAIRGALVGLDLVARVARPRTGFSARSRTARLALLERLARIAPSLDAAVDALGRIAVLAYWSDAGVRAALGQIDAEPEATDGAGTPSGDGRGPRGSEAGTSGADRRPAAADREPTDAAAVPARGHGRADAGGRR